MPGQAPAQKLKVLFLCTGNSCRSQMAEGWARSLHPERLEVWSAGVETHGMNASAVKVMNEVGVDISGHHSKLVDTLLEIPFDYVVTVCDHAAESCPRFPDRARVVHHSFPDPPRLAADAADEQEALDHYRRVRDLIADYVQDLPDTLRRS